MILGTMNHLALTASDIARSAPFYQAILGFIGYEQVEKNDNFIMWWSKDAGAILLYAANPDSPNKVHDRYSPGLHHLAFNADSREQVDNLYQLPNTTTMHQATTLFSLPILMGSSWN